jgi:hypothetical protein
MAVQCSWVVAAEAILTFEIKGQKVNGVKRREYKELSLRIWSLPEVLLLKSGSS